MLSKRYITIFTSAIVLLSATAFAGKCQVHGMHVGSVFSGKTSCENASEKHISVNGPLTAINSTISGNASIRGPVNATDFSVKGNLAIFGPTKAKKMTVGGNFSAYGPVEADALTVGGKVTVQGLLHVKFVKLKNVMVNGPVDITDSVVNGTLSYAGNTGLITHSTVNDVVIRGSRNQGYVLCLSSQSKVKGDVKFVGAQGKIYLADNSTIKGSVSNAQVIKGVCSVGR